MRFVMKSALLCLLACAGSASASSGVASSSGVATGSFIFNSTNSTNAPTFTPTVIPTTKAPTTVAPSFAPTVIPTTLAPTISTPGPTVFPTFQPTVVPPTPTTTAAPTATPFPSSTGGGGNGGFSSSGLNPFPTGGNNPNTTFPTVTGTGTGTGTGAINFNGTDLFNLTYTCTMTPDDWVSLKSMIGEVINSGHGPVLVRNSFHDAGTYDTSKPAKGGPHATMRFAKVANWKDNRGLNLARNILDPMKSVFGDKISHADLWQFAGAVVISNSGGPLINFRPGRADFTSESQLPDDGVLPDGQVEDTQPLRQKFGRMGFPSKAVVALSGAHVLGTCHLQTSGFSGRWTQNNLRFSHQYFINLMKNIFPVGMGIDLGDNPNAFRSQWNQSLGDQPVPSQPNHPANNLMMLNSDFALFHLGDTEFINLVQAYAADEQLFFADFKTFYQQMQELGMNGLLDNKEIIDVTIPGFAQNITTTIPIDTIDGSTGTNGGASSTGSNGGASSTGGSFTPTTPSPAGNGTVNGTCVHSPCETGVALSSGCSSIVAAICAVDSFCCTPLDSWDAICVREVATVAGFQGCNSTNTTTTQPPTTQTPTTQTPTTQTPTTQTPTTQAPTTPTPTTPPNNRCPPTSLNTTEGVFGVLGADYVNNQDCSTVISPVLSSGGGLVWYRVEFFSFDTELGFDFVTMFATAQNSSFQLFHQSGTAVMVNPLVWIQAQTLVVNWHSDVSVTRTGWQIGYNITTDAPPSGAPGVVVPFGMTYEGLLPTPTPTTPPPMNRNCPPASFNTTQGVFGVLGSDYVNNQNCSIVIFPLVFPAGGALSWYRIDFLAFDTESGFDFLTIFATNAQNAQFTQVFHQSGIAVMVNPLVWIQAQTLVVNWQSDVSVTRPGWQIDYNITRDEPAPGTPGVVVPFGMTYEGVLAATPAPTTPPPNPFNGTCAHSVCHIGVALTPNCSLIVSEICQADSFCCDTEWDRICVSEVSSMANMTCPTPAPTTPVPTTLPPTTPPPTIGNCSHSLCTPGFNLTRGCSPAVDAICSADAFCCDTFWDRVCVIEVSLISGLQCPPVVPTPTPVPNNNNSTLSFTGNAVSNTELARPQQVLKHDTTEETHTARTKHALRRKITRGQ